VLPLHATGPPHVTMRSPFMSLSTTRTFDRSTRLERPEAVVRHGFEDLGLHRIHANHFGSNPASGKVMRKVGMSDEGFRPEHYKKRGKPTRTGWATGYWLAIGARTNAGSPHRASENPLYSIS
jgi:hypothetical protein